MTIGARSNLELDARSRQALSEAAGIDDFATAVVEQPFFARTAILDVTVPPSRRVYVARSGPGQFHLLTGRLERLNEVAAADPPEGLDDPALAREYLIYAGAWTTASTGRELQLAAVDDIPWWEEVDEAQQAQIDEVKQAFASRIMAPELSMAFPRYELRQWLLVGQTLVERTLATDMLGQFARAETVHRRELPAPPGRIWGHKDGRFVPVG